MVFNRKMTKEAGSNVSATDCLVLHKYSQGLQANLSGKGKRREGEMVRCSSSSHYLAPAGGGQCKLQGGLLVLPLVFPLWILLVKSGTHRPPCCCSSNPCWRVRCPFQTEHHPQLHASGHDCLSCSNCLLLLWSLRLRCQG